MAVVDSIPRTVTTLPTASPGEGEIYRLPDTDDLVTGGEKLFIALKASTLGIAGNDVLLLAIVKEDPIYSKRLGDAFTSVGVKHITDGSSWTSYAGNPDKKDPSYGITITASNDLIVITTYPGESFSGQLLQVFYGATSENAWYKRIPVGALEGTVAPASNVSTPTVESVPVLYQAKNTVVIGAPTHKAVTLHQTSDTPVRFIPGVITDYLVTRAVGISTAAEMRAMILAATSGPVVGAYGTINYYNFANRNIYLYPGNNTTVSLDTANEIALAGAEGKVFYSDVDDVVAVVPVEGSFTLRREWIELPDQTNSTSIIDRILHEKITFSKYSGGTSTVIWTQTKSFHNRQITAYSLQTYVYGDTGDLPLTANPAPIPPSANGYGIRLVDTPGTFRFKNTISLYLDSGGNAVLRDIGIPSYRRAVSVTHVGLSEIHIPTADIYIDGDNVYLPKTLIPVAYDQRQAGLDSYTLLFGNSYVDAVTPTPTALRVNSTEMLVASGLLTGLSTGATAQVQAGDVILVEDDNTDLIAQEVGAGHVVIRITSVGIELYAGDPLTPASTAAKVSWDTNFLFDSTVISNPLSTSLQHFNTIRHVINGTATLTNDFKTVSLYTLNGMGAAARYISKAVSNTDSFTITCTPNLSVSSEAGDVYPDREVSINFYPCQPKHISTKIKGIAAFASASPDVDGLDHLGIIISDLHLRKIHINHCKDGHVTTPGINGVLTLTIPTNVPSSALILDGVRELSINITQGAINNTLKIFIGGVPIITYIGPEIHRYNEGSLYLYANGRKSNGVRVLTTTEFGTPVLTTGDFASIFDNAVDRDYIEVSYKKVSTLPITIRPYRVYGIGNYLYVPVMRTGIPTPVQLAKVFVGAAIVDEMAGTSPLVRRIFITDGHGITNIPTGNDARYLISTDLIDAVTATPYYAIRSGTSYEVLRISGLGIIESSVNPSIYTKPLGVAGNSVIPNGTTFNEVGSVINDFTGKRVVLVGRPDESSILGYDFYTESEGDETYTLSFNRKQEGLYNGASFSASKLSIVVDYTSADDVLILKQSPDYPVPSPHLFGFVVELGRSPSDGIRIRPAADVRGRAYGDPADGIGSATLSGYDGDSVISIEVKKAETGIFVTVYDNYIAQYTVPLPTVPYRNTGTVQFVLYNGLATTKETLTNIVFINKPPSTTDSNISTDSSANCVPVYSQIVHRPISTPLDILYRCPETDKYGFMDLYINNVSATTVNVSIYISTEDEVSDQSCIVKDASVVGGGGLAPIDIRYIAKGERVIIITSAAGITARIAVIVQS